MDSKYAKCILKFNDPRFQDITPMFNDSVPFLVSGEMLMLTAMLDENYNSVLGGQSLHFIYICERLLNVFKKNNGSFEILFFDVWENVFNNYQLLLYRQILINHFEKNTEIRVHHFTDVYDLAFSTLIDTARPGFFLYNLDNIMIHKFLKHQRCGDNIFLAVFCAEFISCLKSDLPVVDLGTIELEISIVRSYLLENDVDYKILPEFRSDIEKIHSIRKLKIETLSSISKYNDIRKLLVCNAVCAFLKKFPTRTNDVRLFVLYVVALENLKLQNRGCPFVKITNQDIKQDIFIWQKIIFSLLKDVDSSNINWKNICDIWQGTLLAVVYHCVTDVMYSENLGQFRSYYEQYFEITNCILSENLSPYPIEPYKTQFCTFKMPYCRERVVIPLEIINTPIVKSFCGNLIGYVTWADPKLVFGNNEVYYDEIRHWHSRKPITDDCDHVKCDELDQKKATKKDIEKYQNRIAVQARWINLYGRNLIGSDQIYDAIICQEGSKGTTKLKERNKVKEMKAQINKNKNEEDRKSETERFSSLKIHCKNASDLDDLIKMMTKIELLEEKLKIVDVSLDCLILKATIQDKICTKLMKKGDVPDSDKEKLFLTIRKALKIHPMECVMSPRQQKKISKILYKLGFKDIALHNNLPSVDIDGDVYSKESSIRFQLRYLGPKLEREITGVYDDDVRFIPDPWQSRFIEAIRHNQSTLVVAPTSSGKTFASYYCMKRVLRESKNGIVIYVSPTKALVNQVAATITVKFHNAPSQNGIATVGVFTRDFRINAMNCRILVTVPQCLEILLMSPRRYTWAKKIKYVIFDEVHCLKGLTVDTTGVVWERCILLIRCPFLALSATIRNPEGFHKWLVDTERFKEQQDIANGFDRWYDSKVNLVVHSERHSDLVKYTYLQGKGLQHCHPYSFFDPNILNLYDGIPDGTNLSSLELLQLYDAIKVNGQKYLSGNNVLETYFSCHSKNGFITYRDLKNFEKILGNIFIEIYKTDIKCYQAIFNNLQPTHVVTRDDVGYKYSKDNMMDLLTTLDKENMLPALIFCYDRGYIQSLTTIVTENLESCASTKALDRREAKKAEKQLKREKKELHKQEALMGEPGSSYKRSPESLILGPSSSFLKGVGIVDHDDIELIERRLARRSDSYTNILVRAMQQGIAFHHAGLNNTYRSAIEMLFRVGVLKLVFATGTLAMGIHMPCKTVVICCDSPYISSLEYHQMAGRAGRRGFDNEGNVVFIGLNKRRQKTLLTSRLPVIDGNFPLTITFIMRILLLVSRVTDDNEQTEESQKRTLSSALTLLENSLSYRKLPLLRDQMKHFFCFGTQLLYLQKLISLNGMPLPLCSIITHLHYHEPANFAFVYLLRNGALRQMIKDKRGDNVTIQWNLILVMNFLFARLPLHPIQVERKRRGEHKNSCVILEPIPKIIEKALQKYNQEVKFVFDEYFASMSKYCTENLGPDNKLPLSQLRFDAGIVTELNNKNCILNKIGNYCKTRSICSSFCSLSSHGDDNLYSELNLISNVRDDVCTDVKVVPIIDVDLKINSYAADFYRHGIAQAIVIDNGLKHGQEFQSLHDFLLVLKTIVLALEELEPIDDNDVILYHFRKLYHKFQENFANAFLK